MLLINLFLTLIMLMTRLLFKNTQGNKIRVSVTSSTKNLKTMKIHRNFVASHNLTVVECLNTHYG